MTTEPHTKKRKHAHAAVESETPKKKKEKRDKVRSVDEGAKSASTPKQEKAKKRDKGKSKATSEFHVVKASLSVSIPPVFATNQRAGVEEMLDSMIMRYIPAFQGVVLAHSNLHFLNSSATIIADCPFSVCAVGFDATVWSPRVSMKLAGKVNLCSPDHVSLLVHRTFNVSIPRNHIPTDHWEFEYGPAENDPEFGAGVTPEEDGEDGEKDGNEDVQMEGVDGKNTDETKDEHESEGNGRWIHKITGEKLGGPEGYLEFTVIG
ncbi:hypothetical protein SERLADRAFT_361209 [Serpula lacrymans var. lacrymans S7.9]|uniref:RPA43 OB domain-containing protein n=1 Tax=Serpula lacrymans var. lacrymans (strain S7.9) TaxID=578457 RepID=F8NTF3_SERL9|nr:uncharacterized protein SERLADRAFT_361209 [Serpula lacrymans var. lacrymans S7.9]EGO25625.1 hypothetical protein SERLADRAFT_361209 [Serpula lacrymans var. lacrymans S7.9]